MENAFVIKKPWITEKSTMLAAANQYVFMVQPTATKAEVKKAVKTIYKVDAIAVNMVNRPRKVKRFGMKKGAQERYRKAIVTVKEGQKIDLN